MGNDRGQEGNRFRRLKSNNDALTRSCLLTEIQDFMRRVSIQVGKGGLDGSGSGPIKARGL